MGDGTTDDLKGRTKEAAGDLTDDESLKNEGASTGAGQGQGRGRQGRRQAEGLVNRD